jgi:hypothetical protein
VSLRSHVSIVLVNKCIKCDIDQFGTKFLEKSLEKPSISLSANVGCFGQFNQSFIVGTGWKSI